MISEEIKALYDLTEDVLLLWLDDVPTDKLSDSCQSLHSACVNLGIGGDE